MNIKSGGIIGYGSFGGFVSDVVGEKFPYVAVKMSSTSHAPDGNKFFLLSEVCKTDVLILCVPISAYSDTVEKIQPLIGENTIVCDVATVKMYTAGLLRDLKIPRYISTHPMFGPYSYAKRGNSLADLRIAVCDSNLPARELTRIVDFLKTLGLKVLEMTPDAHDKLGAETLFLTHLVGQTIRRGGFHRTEIDTVSFGYLMDAVESVAHDESLFHDVFTYNPHCKSVLERFEKAQGETAKSLEKYSILAQ